MFPKGMYLGLCISKNLEDVLAPEVVQLRDSILQYADGETVYESLLRTMHPDNKCGCIMEVADGHHSSNPCVDFSSFNVNKPKLNGPTLYVIVSFVSSRATLQEQRWTYDNPPGLAQWICKALDKLYFIDCVQGQNSRFG